MYVVVVGGQSGQRCFLQLKVTRRLRTSAVTLGRRPEQKVHIFGKINNYLAERVSLLLLSEVCLVTINTYISVFPPISLFCPV